MRHIALVLLLGSMVNGLTVCEAQVGQRGPWRGAPSLQTEERYRERLLHEQYETAIAKERAERAQLEHEARMYEYQREQQEMYLHRADQEQEYNHRSHGINNINQVANTVGNIVRQVEVLSQGRRGW